MAQDPRNILVAGNLRISTAPLGTTLPTALPTDPSTLNLDAAFKDLGYTSPDGSKFTTTRTTEGIQVHQERGNVRTLVTDELAQATFNLREWNRETVTTSFGGGTITSPASGVWKYEPPAPEDISEFSAVLDLFDGDQIWRFVLRRAMVSNSPESNFIRTGSADLPITLDCLVAGGGVRNWYALTNWVGMSA